jgi:diguanylate cyclase (GGDEF)-like protein
MIVRELLAKKGSTGIISVSRDALLSDVAETLRAHNIGAAIVVDDEGATVGIVSERDLVTALASHGAEMVNLPVTRAMTHSVIYCTPNDGIADVLKLMNTKRIRHIPVLQNGTPRAMLSIREFDHAYWQLQMESRTDELTGLANRRSFLETLDREMNRRARFGTPVALAIVDIDHFKAVNDSFGHAVGDEVLRATAGVLASEVRSFDEVGRIGGEEFAIIFPNTDAATAAAACERLLAAIRTREVSTEAGPTRVTASIGISDSSTGVIDGRFLMKSADRQLYIAKHGGRNRISVDSATHRERTAAPSVAPAGEFLAASAG